MLLDLDAINANGELYLKPFYVWVKQCDLVKANINEQRVQK